MPNFVSPQGATCALVTVEEEDGRWSFASAGHTDVCAGVPWSRNGTQAALERLLAWSRQRGRSPLLFGVEFADLAHLRDWKIREIGRQPLFVAGSVHDPHLSGAGQPEQGREMRRQARRAQSKGANWRRVSAGEVAELRDQGVLWPLLRTRWLRQPLAEFSFLVGLHLQAGHQRRRYFLLELQGSPQPAGLAILVESDRGWLLEHQIVGANAPNGSGELLVCQILTRELQAGELLSLGITPLYRALVADVSHQEIPGILSFMPKPLRTALLEVWEPLYGFRRLERFRTKLDPERWEPVYWAHHRGTAAGALLAVLRVFAGGSLLGFACATVGKLMGKLALALSRDGLARVNLFFLLSLCFWIPILWNLDGERLFGTVVATKMWALYDVVLVVGFALHQRLLRQSGGRFRTLSAVMLGLVLADAGLSLIWSLLLHGAAAPVPLSAFLALLTAAPLVASLFFLLCLAYPTDFLRHGGSRAELENL